MFVPELHETLLYINSFRVLDLRKPFHRIVGDEDSVDKLLRTPTESLSRAKKPLTYYVKVTEKRAGALFHSEVQGLKCHWVYNTNTSVSPLFRDKALTILLKSLETQNETYKEVRRYLTGVVRLLWKSFPFDCIITSIETLPLLLPEVPIHILPLTLTSLPKQTAFPSTRHTTLKAVLKGHPEGIPLSLLTGDAYSFLSLKHTTFDKKLLQDVKNVLIIEGTNTSYAGFLARELYFLPGVKQVLPTTLFHIGQ